MSDKPREFYGKLEERKDESRFLEEDVTPDSFKASPDWIRTVEYSALDRANERIKEMETQETQTNLYIEDLLACAEAGHQKLEFRIANLRQALKVYAHPPNWRTNSGKIGITLLTDGRDSEMIDGQFTNGKVARDAIAADDKARGE